MNLVETVCFLLLYFNGSSYVQGLVCRVLHSLSIVAFTYEPCFLLLVHVQLYTPFISNLHSIRYIYLCILVTISVIFMCFVGFISLKQYLYICCRLPFCCILFNLPLHNFFLQFLFIFNDWFMLHMYLISLFIIIIIIIIIILTTNIIGVILNVMTSFVAVFPTKYFIDLLVG